MESQKKVHSEASNTNMKGRTLNPCYGNCVFPKKKNNAIRWWCLIQTLAPGTPVFNNKM